MNKLNADGVGTNKKTVALKVLKNTHEMALQFSLKSLQKNLTFSEKLEKKVCDLIEVELKKVIEITGENNFLWGK